MTSSGAATPEQVLKSLLDAGEVSQANVKWGKGYRDVIIVGSKKYQYKKGGTVNKILRNKIIPLYISMSDKSLNNKLIIDDLVAPDDEDKFGLGKSLSQPARRLRRKTLVKPIHKFAKQHAQDFKQEDHEIQVVYDIVTTKQDGKTTAKILQHQGF